jgi:hypothetical protein
MWLAGITVMCVMACCCCRVLNAHEDWVEGLLVCQGSNGNQDAFDQSLYSFSADGHVCSWELDAEQNCDVYRLVVSATAAVMFLKLKMF